MCKFRPHGFVLQKKPPKWHFFAILGLRMGLFGGLNCALVVIHLKGCITTSLGPLLGDSMHKKCESREKNRKKETKNTQKKVRKTTAGKPSKK